MRMTNAVRYDASPLKAKIHADGYIHADAIVTRTGIFNYQNADGSIRRELRHPEDVFHNDSINSMHMIPITNGHPQGRLVNSKNVSELSIGSVGQNVRVDGKHVIAPIAITHENGIQAVKNGRKQLSLGYTADIDDTPGVYDGMQYDARQKNIKYNHLAIVDIARAGASARIHLDSEDAIQIDSEDEFNKEEGIPQMNLSNVHIDGVSYEAPLQVINALNKSEKSLNTEKSRADGLENQLTTLKTEVESLKGERDTLKDRCDSLEKADHSAAIKAAAKERASLIENAAKILHKEDVAKLDAMDDLEIKKEIIKKVSPNAKLDGQTDVYISARYDGVIEMVANQKDFSVQTAKVNGVLHADAESTRDDSGESPYEKARNQYIANLGKRKGENK